MAGRQAKILTDEQVTALCGALRDHRYPDRDTAIFLLSAKAGLRAGEIARLTWGMVLAADGTVGTVIELHDRAAKMGGGRSIPIGAALREALQGLAASRRPTTGPVIRSERGGPMRPSSVVNWFAAFYRKHRLKGCSSHSGRRTFITKAARLVHEAGGSLRDVQQLAGHKSIAVTQRYIEGDTAVKRRLMELV